MTSQRDALRGIARSVSLHPPILGEQRLGRTVRSVATLAATLRDLDDSNRELTIPTRAVLGRALVVGKINFLVMLRRLAGGAAGLRPYRRDLDEAVLQNVMLLMGEDVFLSLIGDDRSSDRVRGEAARRLAGIWERRLDRGLANHVPALLSLWKTRRILPPIYGTLMGVSEITRLALHVDPAWAEFLARERSIETAHALEEFVFGLSHEELQALRRAMKSRGLASVDPRRVAGLVGRRRYAPFENGDPRKLFVFYRQRRAAAAERLAADRPGPRFTIEELLLGHLVGTGAGAEDTAVPGVSAP